MDDRHVHALPWLAGRAGGQSGLAKVSLGIAR
jgi:hypothetical protein